MPPYHFLIFLIVGSMWIWLPLAIGLYMVGNRRFSGRGCIMLIVLELVAIVISMWSMSFVARH
jgi:hypothetical protein